MFFREDSLHSPALSDLLNFAALVEDGVVLLKDGSFLAAFTYSGPDLNSASHAELAALSGQINNAVSRFGNGWMFNIDLIRRPSVSYPTASHFPDEVTAFIEEERRDAYLSAGDHFESKAILALTYKPPAEVQSRLSSIFLDGIDDRGVSWSGVLNSFICQLKAIEDALSARLNLERLDSDALLTFLHTCITGHQHPIKKPTIPMYLDSVLSSEDFVAGFSPRIGDKHICVIAVTGFPALSRPEILTFLDNLPCEFRWSNRFICLDPQTADRELRKYRRHWFQKRHGLLSFVKESFNIEGQTYLNQDALRMADDADEAVTEASSLAVAFGYYTCTIILFDEDRDSINANSRLIVKQLQHHGFAARVEKINAIESYLGSIPGHGYYNVRRPLINTLNLADLLPLTSVWPGLEQNPSPYFDPGSPPLFYCSTEGATPFRFNLHVSDVGHTLIVGPTGAGKSTLLGLIMAQFFRYRNAQVFCFDKGYSGYILAKASGGEHYDIAGPNGKELAFCPLRDLSNPGDLLWAEQFIEDLLELQGVVINPFHKKCIHKALALISESPTRTLTELDIQEESLNAALSHYTVAGGMPILDAVEDLLGTASFQVFELEHLMSLGHKNVIPVLLYLFHCIEKRLDGRPTLVVLEEAWLMLMNSTFAKKLEDWLRTLRKKNASVVLVTQSLSEIANCPQGDLIIESCPTKLFLPNPEACTPYNSDLYKKIGLTPRQIDIISQATPKQHYYYSSPLGKRLIDLKLGYGTLSFIGASGQKDLHRVRELERLYGDNWVDKWLEERGVN